MADGIRSHRGRILVALKRQLDTIMKVNGYATDVNAVKIDLRNWSELPEAETPVLFIVGDQSQNSYGPHKHLEVSWTVLLIGYMRNRSQLELEEWIADIEECLWKNLTLGFEDAPKVCNHFRIQEIVVDNQMFSELPGAQIFRVNLQINYTRCAGDPR